MASDTFEEVRVLKNRRVRSRLKKYCTQLPQSLIDWIDKESVKHRVPKQALLASLLITGIARYEKEKPLG